MAHALDLFVKSFEYPFVLEFYVMQIFALDPCVYSLLHNYAGRFVTLYYLLKSGLYK